LALRLAGGIAVLMPICAAWAAFPDPVRFGLAVELGDTRTVRNWLDEGLSPEFMSERLGTGLMIAAWEGNLAMMELFVSRGANVNRTNRNGEQALQLAAWNGHLEAVKWLLEHGAAISRTGKQWSALHYAVFAGHKDVARLLIERGADVNGRAPNDATVLMMAAREGQEELARSLLDAGADPHLLNDRGETALVWAMRHRNLKIAQLVSSAAEFAQAAQAPPDTFGAPNRSVPPPAEVAQVLRQMRMAQAQGRPVADLQQAFYEGLAAFRKGDALTAPPAPKLPKAAASVTSGRPKALLITAKRHQPGSERARLVYDEVKKAQPLQQATATDVEELLRRIRLAEAQGRPTDALREALYDAVLGFKRQGTPAAAAAEGME